MNEGTCLLCFAVNRRTIDIINTDLQQVYEKIAGFKFQHASLCLCYICHKRLQQCQQLWRLAEQTQSLLKNFQEDSHKFDSNLETPKALIELSTANVVIVSISIDDGDDDDDDDDLIKIEPDVKKEKLDKSDIKHVGIGNSNEFENTEKSFKSSDSEDDVPLNNIRMKHEVDAERNKTEVDPKGNKDIEHVSIENNDVFENTEKSFKSSDSEDDVPLNNIRMKHEVDAERNKTEVDPKGNKDIKLEAQEITLSEEEQMREFLQRATSANYACSPYKCGLCYRGFVHPAAYDKHREKHDERSGANACGICQLRYASARQLRAHAAAAHARRYACPRCPHRAHTRNQAKEHEKWHRGHTYLCNLCGVKFSKPTTYLTHRRKRHAGASACARCGEGFATPHGLRLHTTKAHGRCPPTEAVEPSADSLCKVCDIQFDNTAAWRRHVLTSDRHTIWNEHNDVCKVCGEAVEPAERRRHERAHARELAPRAAHTRPPLQLACDQCGAYATSKSNLRAHVRRVHLGLKYDKQLVCEVCGKNCSSNATLRYHQRRHTGERPYGCACGARFADANQLRIHARTHSGERPYACHLCQRRFAQKPALNKHYRVHTGAKPYECQFCKRSFSQTNSLKLHVRAVHLKLPPNNRKKNVPEKIKKDNVEVIND